MHLRTSVCGTQHQLKLIQPKANKKTQQNLGGTNSDGGPDHRVTFGSVQVASLSLFCSLDLDMLVCVRTCPYQSWTNVAERIMSTLNLALQNVSLARSNMSQRAEAVLKKKKLCMKEKQ